MRTDCGAPQRETPLGPRYRVLAMLLLSSGQGCRDVYGFWSRSEQAAGSTEMGSSPGATDRIGGANREGRIDANVQEIRDWEEAALHRRSRAERVSDWITDAASRSSVVLAHAVWFVGWIVINVGWVPGVRAFDPFPFQLLTTAVSLEAIFLTLFVLASQNRMTQQGDKRAHLDLQIDMLAEREMTAVLQLLDDIVRHLDIKTNVSATQLRDLAKETDIHKLTHTLDESAARADGSSP